VSGFDFTPLRIPVVAQRRSPSPDFTAPGFVSAATQSGLERVPMRMTVTTDEPATLTLGGTDAALLQIASNSLATSHVIELVGDANLDRVAKASYSFTVKATDAANNASAFVAHTFNVTGVMDVSLQVGDSNTGPGKNSLLEIPNNFLIADAGAKIYDKRVTDAIITLPAPTYSPVTLTVGTPGVVNWTGHNLAVDTPVVLSTTGGTLTGATVNTVFYVAASPAPTTNAFSIAATRGGSAVAFSGSQTGIHTMCANILWECQSDFQAYDSSLGFNSSVGAVLERIKHWRVDHATAPHCTVTISDGGSRFSDLGPAARAGNWDVSLTDGAYATASGFINSFLTKLAAMGYVANWTGCRISGPANGVILTSEANAFGAKHYALMQRLRTDFLGNSCKIVIERLSTSQTGFSSYSANVATMRAAELANARADVNAAVSNADGFPCIDSPRVHWTTGGHIIGGEQFHHLVNGIWFPQSEWADIGGNVCTHEWRFGDLRNLPSPPNGLLSGAVDCVGTILGPVQANSLKQPSIASAALANGYPTCRTATGNGSNQILICTSGVPFAYNGDWSFSIALKSASGANKAFFGLGGPLSKPNALLFFGTDGSGNLVLSHRDDAGFSTPIASGLAAFNNVMNSIQIWKVGTNVYFRLNGTETAAQTFNPATTTLDRFAFFGAVAGGTTESLQMPVTIWGAHVAGPGDSAYRARVQGFHQRHAGTV
jgi:hypothetical protein